MAQLQLLDLPTEIKLYLFRYLSAKDLLTLSTVCSNIKEILSYMLYRNLNITLRINKKEEYLGPYQPKDTGSLQITQDFLTVNDITSILQMSRFIIQMIQHPELRKKVHKLNVTVILYDFQEFEKLTKMYKDESVFHFDHPKNMSLQKDQNCRLIEHNMPVNLRLLYNDLEELSYMIGFKTFNIIYLEGTRLVRIKHDNQPQPGPNQYIHTPLR
ncbi:hypothetical protein WICPIJ_008282 [Wickerhamomyces pijperi]|uniref:F-box domain-containing protein n=1 Tax=Wickerhamomyces pijperi TaxID=599730 RepID=A0A9P8PY43_WICPI|nr:hypothetical protein WICPIJ_008282 [Wickerhamomyces pijperi]